MELLSQPWPWYLAGPLIGLFVPLMLLLTNRQLGVSSSFRHVCAACMPGKIEFFRYPWKNESWNLIFVMGIMMGGLIAGLFIPESYKLEIAPDTKIHLQENGIESYSSILPVELFNWQNLFTVEGFSIMILGGFMVGFGARYAGGCTSGHAIMGLSSLQKPSIVAVLGFFIGGLIASHLLMPFILN
jgi:uncharacterized membrane protein YedE/YeeE